MATVWPARSTSSWPVHRSGRWPSALPSDAWNWRFCWLADDRDFWRAVAAVAPSRLWFSLAELIFFALCMAGYLWIAGRPTRRPWLAASLALLASLDLMAHFPPLFTMLNLLADRPSLFAQRLDSPLYRSLLIDPEVLSMTVHVYLAAIAVTAVLLMHRAARLGCGRDARLRLAAGLESASLQWGIRRPWFRDRPEPPCWPLCAIAGRRGA